MENSALPKKVTDANEQISVMLPWMPLAARVKRCTKTEQWIKTIKMFTGTTKKQFA